MRVLIADAEVLFRMGIRNLLQQLDTGVDVVETGSFGEALDHASEVPQLDLIVLDPTMPGMKWETMWCEQLRMLIKRAPAAPIVVITASESPSDILRALEVGVAGYISKRADVSTVTNALKRVLAGDVYVPSTLSRRSGDATRATASGSNRVVLDGPTLTGPLTKRQRQVLALLAEGKTNKNIADEIGISGPTVSIHVTSIFKKLGVANRTQAAVAAVEMRFAEPISAQFQSALATSRYSPPGRRDPIAESSETSVPRRRLLASDADDPTAEELERLRTSIR